VLVRVLVKLGIWPLDVCDVDWELPHSGGLSSKRMLKLLEMQVTSENMFLLEMSSIAYTIPLQHVRSYLLLSLGGSRWEPWTPSQELSPKISSVQALPVDSDLDSDLCGQALRTSFW
jgi:hypothetical protein